MNHHPNPDDPITIPRDLLEWLLDYASELQLEWDWKLHGTSTHKDDMRTIQSHILLTKQLLDNNNPNPMDGLRSLVCRSITQSECPVTGADAG